MTSLYLGRPWRPHAMTLFMYCTLPAAINPSGWDNWRNPDNEQTARYAEFNNSGKGSRPAERVAWSKILTQGEGASITLEKVMGDFYPAIIAETNHLEP